MAEPTSPATVERPAPTLVYRPLSGLAIAGLACGIVYAVLVLGSIVLGFLKREPFFLPLPMLALALAGAVLSVLGLRQVRNSEGTRAGAALARWGLWVSVLSGLGAGTFATVSGLAVEMQANKFLMEKSETDRWSGFFPLLREGETNAAFLLVLPPQDRQLVNPNSDQEMEDSFDRPFDPNSPKGKLTIFREADFVRILQQPCSPRAEVTPMGVKSWTYERGGYKVVRTYRITTPEGEFNLDVAAQSSDPEEPGEPRRWQVLFGPQMKMTPVPDENNEPKLTPLGKQMAWLRESAVMFANGWLKWAFSGDLSLAYVWTRPQDERRVLPACQLTQSAGLAAGGLPGAANFTLPVACAEALNLFPALPTVPGTKLPVVLEAGKFRAPGRDGKFKAAVLLALPPEKLNLWSLTGLPEIKGPDALVARWEDKGRQREITLNLGFQVGLSPDQGAYVLGKLVLSVDKDADPAQGPPAWRVVRLELERAVPALRRSMPKQ